LYFFQFACRINGWFPKILGFCYPISVISFIHSLFFLLCKRVAFNSTSCCWRWLFEFSFVCCTLLSSSLSAVWAFVVDVDSNDKQLQFICQKKISKTKSTCQFESASQTKHWILMYSLLFFAWATKQKN
jgi:hypothetical protein